MSYYLFTVNDIPVGLQKITPAERIVECLKEQKIWLFSQRTPLLGKLKPDDRVLIYICGRERQYFHSEIEICSTVDNSSDNKSIQKLMGDLGIIWMKSSIGINNIREFEPKIYIKPLIQSLSFIKDKKNYGLNLRLPIALIPKEDYDIIIKSIS